MATELQGVSNGSHDTGSIGSGSHGDGGCGGGEQLWFQKPWYHGPVSRTAAVEAVAGRPGDFVVRDCISSPGNYVLTCNAEGRALHFRLNKVRKYYLCSYRLTQDFIFDTSLPAYRQLLTSVDQN